MGSIVGHLPHVSYLTFSLFPFPLPLRTVPDLVWQLLAVEPWCHRFILPFCYPAHEWAKLAGCEGHAEHFLNT